MNQPGVMFTPARLVQDLLRRHIMFMWKQVHINISAAGMLTPDKCYSNWYH